MSMNDEEQHVNARVDGQNKPYGAQDNVDENKVVEEEKKEETNLDDNKIEDIETELRFTQEQIPLGQSIDATDSIVSLPLKFKKEVDGDDVTISYAGTLSVHEERYGLGSDSDISLTTSHTGVSLFSITAPTESQTIVEKEEEEETPEEPAIDRELYYELYDRGLKELHGEKIKNNFLHRKLAEYYKKRNQEHAFVERSYYADLQKRYEKLLEQAVTLSENAHKQETETLSEIARLKRQRTIQSTHVQEMFQNLLQNEEEFIKEINHLVDDKVIGRYIRRQRLQMEEKIKMRLKYVKIKNMYEEKLEALDRLNNFGPNMHLIDYEQLKVDNRTHKDKLEEREGQLASLRTRCRNNMQVLAHGREKAAALDMDIRHAKSELESVEEDIFCARERLDSIKREKGRLRQTIRKLTVESGLLTHPRLVIDFHDSVEEVVKTDKKAKEYKNECYSLNDSIQRVRNNMVNIKNPGRRSSRERDMFLPRIT